jgi:hypothetical protein
MEVFGWANVKKAAMAAGSTNGSNLSSSSIPSPQSGVGLLISPLQGGLSSNTDISIGSDLLQQLHQDHLLAAGETRRRPPAAAHRLPSEGSFGLSSADPFDDEFNATMVFPSMPAQFSDNLQPAADRRSG